jgi:hypothetical protein
MRSVDEWLRSEETGQPFSHCVSCRLPLLEIDAPWLVNKDYFRGECVLEYAICQGCRDRMTGMIPEDSKEAVRGFLEREIDWNARVAEFMAAHDPASRFSNCIACRTPRGEMAGFGISALFDSGGHLVTGSLPLLICRCCIGRMSGLLCDETRGVWKQFLNEHFTGPPDDSGFTGLL